MSDVEDCDRCNGSGEVALNAFTMTYKCAGPVPDDARGVVAETCAKCRGIGYVECDATGDAYGALRGILDEAYNQSAKGKGLERHGNGKAWTEQPILAITRDTGIGFPTGQAIKKVTEAVGMLGRGEGDAAARELLGAIVYTAAAIHFIREFV